MLTPVERRTALVELSEAQLREALASVLPRAELSSFELTTGGRANTNYVLATSRGRFVLRLHVREPGSGAKERALHTLVAPHIPTAPVVGRGMLASGHTFSLLGFVEGDTLEELLSSGDGRRLTAAAHGLGRVLGELSFRRFLQAGELVVRPSGALEVEAWPFDDYFRWVLFESAAAGRLGSTRERLWTFLQHAQQRYPDAWHTHLVHGDFNPSNLLIGDSGEVAAVLDWEFAHAGKLWLDLGNLLRHRPESPLPDAFEPALLAGLGEGGVTLPDHWRALSLLTDLSSACEFLSSTDERPQTHARALEQIHATLRVLG
jgi:aminoglycoside phosphotransferase (APT) family kinase protein